MPNGGFNQLDFADFGLGVTPLPDSTGTGNPGEAARLIVPAPDIIYGIEIGPDSEIDCCWLMMDRLGRPAGLEGAIPTESGYGKNQNLTITPMGPVGAVKLSVEHPIVGPLQGPIRVAPYYSWAEAYGPVAGVTGDSFGRGHAHAKLSLRYFTQPPVAPPTTRRAVLRRGWFTSAPGAMLVIPTFGRRLLRAWAWDPVGGNINVDYIWTVPAQGFVTGFTANPIVVPAGGPVGAGGLGVAGANLLTQDVPDWMVFYDDGANKIRSFLVEAYD